MEYDDEVKPTEANYMDVESRSNDDSLEGNDNKKQSDSQDMFATQYSFSPSQSQASIGLRLSPSGNENYTMSNKLEDNLSHDFQGRLKNDLQLENGTDEDSSDEEEAEVKTSDESEDKLSGDDEEEEKMYKMNRMPVKEEAAEYSSLASSFPITVKTSGEVQKQYKSDENRAEKDKERPEVGVDILMEGIKKRKIEKEAIVAEIKEVGQQIEAAMENKRLRTSRMEVLSSKTTKIEAELFRSTEVSEANKKKEEKKLLDTSKINEKINESKKLVKTLELSSIRLMLGKKQGEAMEETTLGRIQENEKNLTIFFPGTLESQPSIIKEELKKVENMSIITCQDDSIKKMVGAVKNYEVTKERKGDVGMFILKVGKVLGTVDEGIIKTNVNKMMTQLQLIISRGVEKFEEQVFVIPPASLENWKAVRMLGQQMKEKKGGFKIIDILEEQMEKGMTNKDKNEAVWTTEDLVLDKKYENEEGGSGCLNEYSFRRCLDRVARLLEGKGEEGTPWCEVCGFTHSSGNCLLDTAKK